jgi:hypothetical protein
MATSSPWRGLSRAGRCGHATGADFDAGHFGVDEEPERVLELVAFHQPVQRLMAQLGQVRGTGVAGQARSGDLQG